MFGGERGFGLNPLFEKIAGSDFSRPKGARRVRYMDALNTKITGGTFEPHNI